MKVEIFSNQHDFHELNRFVEAQNSTYQQALTELTFGLKKSHWMWFIFPQIEGLGVSSTSRFYSIKSMEEAKAYLDHPLLGPRLIECTEAVLLVKDKSAKEIFGSPDDQKLRSSMTLFGALHRSSPFSRVLDKYYSGKEDQRTLTILEKLGMQR